VEKPNGQGPVYQRADDNWPPPAHHRIGSVREGSGLKAPRQITQLDKGLPVAGESSTVQQYFGYWLNHLVKVKAAQDLPGLRGHRAPLHHARSRPAEATVVAS
jgi:hypothetical protein